MFVSSYTIFINYLLIQNRMHETIFATQIIEEAKKYGDVKKIIVESGELGHVPPEEMRAVLERMVPDWEVVVEEKEAIVKCGCGYVGKPNIVERGHDHAVFFCPECNAVPEIIEGKDIVLKSVELKD